MTELAILSRVPLFTGVPEEELRWIAEVAVERRYERGAIIFFENEPGDALYVISKGQVRIYRVAEDGREKTLALLSDGDFFGEMALIDDEPRSAIAEATEDSILLALHKRDFHNLLQARPQMALSIIRGLSLRMRQTNKQLMEAVFLDVRSRIFRLLLELDDQYGRDCFEGRLLDLKLTHQELANMVGTSRESVTRVLTELQDRQALGYVRRHLMWIDREKLVEQLEKSS